jgi:hypothetical protein
MKYEKYDVETSPSLLHYEFYSRGSKGVVLKRVTFEEYGSFDAYNIAFGDVGADSQIDDLAVTDNGDGNTSYTAFLIAAKDVPLHYGEEKKGTKEDTKRRIYAYHQS